MSDLLRCLPEYLKSQLEAHDVPAISLAIWHEGQLYQDALGILNIETGIRATTDAVFQIGSITKVFTACLIMQLVEEGRLDLDNPVKTYLRDFQVADQTATNKITVRQILNHTSGIAGDFFPDEGDGNGDAIARYLDRINLIPQVYSPGKKYSYTNSAYVVAGRLIEVLSAMSWHLAVKERIYTPLGMSHSFADLRDSLYYLAAVGHTPDLNHKTGWRVLRDAYSVRGLAPSGTVLSMTATDLVRFGQMHLGLSEATYGRQWLSLDSIRSMQTPTITLPKTSDVFDHYWGLGWGLSKHKSADKMIVWHSGQVMGQCAVLKLIPDHNTVFAIMINGAKPSVARNIAGDILHELVGLDDREPERDWAKLSANQLACYTGTFDSLGSSYVVSIDQDTLNSASPTLGLTCLDKLHETTNIFSLRPISDHIFACFAQGDERMPNVVFTGVDEESGLIELFVGSRVHRRINGTSTNGISFL